MPGVRKTARSKSTTRLALTITVLGYLFLSEDLRKYRLVPGTTVSPEGVFNYGEAAAVLGVATLVIRGLIAQGILHIMAEYRNGLSKLLPAADVQRFAEGYVATSALAKRYHLDSGSLARYLRESGTPLLAIPLPGTGKGSRIFPPQRRSSSASAP